MNTTALKLHDYVKSLSENKWLRLFVKYAALPSLTTFADAYLIVVTGAVIGGAGIVVMPIAINSPQFFGELIAQMCLQNGSCDFTLNMVSLFTGLYILLITVIVLLAPLNLMSLDETDSDDVLAHLSGKNDGRAFSLNELAERFNIKRDEMQVIVEQLIDDEKIERIAATAWSNEQYAVRVKET